MEAAIASTPIKEVTRMTAHITVAKIEEARSFIY